MENDFDEALKLLNEQQLKAVNKIDGPVLVIAGPGTGKTQLLALRAAQILRQDPTMLPGNILCLTFTENAADNMRQRLIRYIGQDAYQIAIHTFNSFGNYIMNLYPEFFYEWREIRTADELTSYRMLEDILSRLPGSHLLARRGSDGEFFSLVQLKNFISDAKRAGLSPEDLKTVLNQNTRAYDELEPIIRESWPDRLSQSSLEKLSGLVDRLSKLAPDAPPVADIVPVKNMVISSLGLAAAESSAASKPDTKPYRAWKDSWLEKDAGGDMVFKASKHSERLLAAAEIYEEYQTALEARGMADFADQIIWVLRAVQQNDDLRYNLQERFNYIMVDEFQDTNRAQLLMVQSLTYSVGGDQPNILAVGDDDQAIFRFQGADIGNVGLFETLYPRPFEVALKNNYRSSQLILDYSRKIGRQISDSLEKRKKLDKSLSAEVGDEGVGLRLNAFELDSRQNSWIAAEIKRRLDAGQVGSEIAVLARERAQLDELVPYLRGLGIPMDYERRDDVLDQPHIRLLVDMSRLVSLLGRQRLEEADGLVAKILSEPMWGIPASDIWRIAQTAYRERKFWLDVIFEKGSPELKKIANFLVITGQQSRTMPFEEIIDKLVGVTVHAPDNEQDEPIPPGNNSQSFVSPFKGYFFNEELLEGKTNEYLGLLANLSTLRQHLRNYQSDERRTLTIDDLVAFVDSYNRAGLRMTGTAPHSEDGEAVKLMTVHKAKGMEFQTVFITGVQEHIWNKRGGGFGRFSYPANLQEIRPGRGEDDDSLRLLYVAMTRAKQDLFICYYRSDEAGKPHQPYGALLALEHKEEEPEAISSAEALAQEYEQRWLKYHGSLSRTEMKACLEDMLGKYTLSATHLNNFTDITSGGPLYFLTQNLLNFPSAKSPSSIYGSIIHDTLRYAHDRIRSGQPIDIIRAAEFFKRELSEQNLSQQDKERYLKQGEESLKAFLQENLARFSKSQIAEFDFRDQGVMVGQARIRGLVDVMDFDNGSKTITVTDYKTGAPVSKWQLPPSAKEYERVKLHRYRQQLLFYKILIDGSAEWGRRGWRADKGILRFVEPDSHGKLRSLSLEYEDKEIAGFKMLLEAVWDHIMRLDFPDTASYPKTFKGILEFEHDLMNKNAAKLI